MRIVLLMLTALTGMFSGISAAAKAIDPAFGLTIENRDFTPQAIAALGRFLKEAEAALPPRMKETISERVVVRFVGLNPEIRSLPDCNSNAADGAQPLKITLGQARSREVHLNALLLPEIVAGPARARKMSCGHGDYYRQALATLIHELVHLYDYKNVHSPEFAEMRNWCESRTQFNSSPPGGCEKYLAINRTVSLDPIYLNIAGWNETGFLFTSRDQENTFKRRSPDPYEYTSAEEHFAVNMEYFLLDPDYACRRPSLYAYLSSHFGYHPYQTRQCKTSNIFVVQSEGRAGTRLELTKVSEKRLYQIHYLMAGSGTETMSRWGHSMFRLVFCAPDRKEPGPECVHDIQHHLVLSFRALVSDMRLSSWQGLNGGYPSQLFIHPLAQVIGEYTSDELRDLTSLPLNLNEQQMQAFIYRMMELQWEYRGDYRFLANNCATEAWNLIRSIDSRGIVQDRSVSTPQGMWDRLIELKLAVPLVLNDLRPLQASGLFFPSRRTQAVRAFSSLAVNIPELQMAYPNLEAYLKDSTPDERRAFYVKAIDRLSAERREEFAGRFYYLEDLMRRRGSLFLADSVAELTLELESKAKIDPAFGALRDDIRKAWSGRINMIFAGVPAGGYGLPLESEVQTATFEDKVNRQAAEYGPVQERVRAYLEQRLVRELAIVRGIAENLRLFASGIR